MSTQLFPLSPVANSYLHQYGLREHPVMQALRHETQTYPYAQMQTLPEQALLLQFLARFLGVKRYLEIGVFTGYSLLAVALVMPKVSKAIGCDIQTDFAEVAKKYWKQAGVDQKVELILQPAEKTLAELSESDPFDFIYIDADKANYLHYYERALTLLRSGGMLALDNMFLQGRVFTETEPRSSSVKTMHQLNVFIHQDPRVEMVMLPLGDGLTLVQKK